MDWGALETPLDEKPLFPCEQPDGKREWNDDEHSAWMLAFTVPGQPQGKGRARFARVGKFMRAYTPAKTVAYEGLIAFHAEQEMRARNLIQGPVEVDVEATFAIPKSWTKKRRAAHAVDPEYHTSKPDADNIMKALDGLNGVVWGDDAQVARCSLCKRYGDNPGLLIKVRPL